MTDIGSEDERFAAFLRSAVRQLDVPETPREAMWAAIAARREHRAPVQAADWSTYVAPPVSRDGTAVAGTVHNASTTEAGTRPSVRLEHDVKRDGASVTPMRRWRAVPLRWAMPIAAGILAVGIGIGNVMHVGRRGAAVDASKVASAAKGTKPLLPTEMLAQQHFNKALVELAKFASTSQQGASPAEIEATNQRMAQWASSMFTMTQSMIDAHAAMDERQVKLLRDLETVLLQMSQLSHDMPDDNEYVRQTIEHEQLLPRLQSASSVTPRSI